MQIFNITAFFTIAAFSYIAITARKRPDQGINIKSNFDNTKLYYTGIAILFAIAFAVRIYEFGKIPFGFNQDGAMAAVDALALAEHGTDRFGMVWPVHFTAWSYGQMSVLMSYMMAVFIKFFGLNEITARLPLLITSLAGIAVFFLYVKEVFGRKKAFYALFLLAVNPWHIMQSRWALDCNLFPHFILFSLYFLYKGIKNNNKNKKYLYISMVFFALTMYTYGIAFYSIPVLLLILVVYLISKKFISIKDAVICAVFYFAFSWPIYAVIFINIFKIPTITTPLFTIPFFENSVRVNDLLFTAENLYNQLISNIYSVINVTIFQKADLPWNSMPEYGPLYFMTPILVFVGIYAAYKQGKSNSNENVVIGTVENIPEEAEGAEAEAENIPEEADGAEAEAKNIPEEAEGAETEAENIPEEADSAEIENVKKIKNIDSTKTAGAFFIIAWLIVAVFAGVLVNGVNINRINIIFYPLIILSGLGLNFVIEKINMKVAAVFICGIYLVLFAGFTSAYFDKDKAPSFFNGFGQSIRYAEQGDFDKIYITMNTLGKKSLQTTEILTMFYACIDSKYFQGFADKIDESGNAMLPYKQRYNYVSFENGLEMPYNDAVFIFNMNETDFFDDSIFDKKIFENYGVAIPKNS